MLTTLLMTQTDRLGLISAIRMLNGIANGVVFVQVPALILEWLVLHRRAHRSGLVYLGVGLGLLLSSALVAGSADRLQGAARWWPAALLSVPLAWWGVAMRRCVVPRCAVRGASFTWVGVGLGLGLGSGLGLGLGLGLGVRVTFTWRCDDSSSNSCRLARASCNPRSL